MPIEVRIWDMRDLMPDIYAKLRNTVLVFIVGVSATLVVFGAARASDGPDQFLSLYGELLKAHVRPSDKGGILYAGVDYDAWASDPRHRNALKLLLNENPEGYATDNERKAFWINAYNFLTIDLIVREGERESINNLGSFFSSPWSKFEWEIAGRSYTLDFIEHDILRPLGDPRIHFAINCASVSCPDLRSEYYRASDLDKQLSDQLLLALSNSGKGLYRGVEKIYVSQIFDWFEEDFNDGDIPGWLRENTAIRGEFPLRYLKYDWSLNKSK
jgi:hypothetical protein